METNKILGAIILALLLAAVFSKVADMAIHPEFPDELAYKIEVPEGGISSETKEEVDIFEVLRQLVVVPMPGQPINLLLPGSNRFRYILLLARSLRLHDVSGLLHETLS